MAAHFGENGAGDAHGGGDTSLVGAHRAPGGDGRTVWKLVEGEAVGQQIALACRVEHVDVIGAVVGVGPAAAIGRDSGHNQVAVDLRQGFPVETQLRSPAGLNVVDEDVGLGCQLAQYDSTLRVVHIQR